MDIYKNKASDFIIRGGVLEKYIGEPAIVEIPYGVSIIGPWAFANCIGITVVLIPDSVFAIKNNAFEKCESLKVINIPDSVVEIGSGAFRGCKSLKTVELSKGIKTIQSYTFMDSGLSSIAIPNSVTIIYDKAFAHCESLIGIEIPSSVTDIGEFAFGGCKNLKEVTIHGEPRAYYDGIGAFEDCNQLTVINASQEWKDKYFLSAQILKDEHYKKTNNHGACYIATAVYGSYDCPQVWTLRRYRDEYLAQSMLGRMFIRTYYAVSPTIVKWFKEKDWFQRFWRDKLDKKVHKLNQKGYMNTLYTDKQNTNII